MTNFNNDPKPSGNKRPSDQPAEDAPAVGSDLSARPGASPVESLPQDDTRVSQGAADDDLLAAVTSISSEALTNIDHTLDQLTSSTDLFDIPAIDLDA
jgi:hypothetical protein